MVKETIRRAIENEISEEKTSNSEKSSTVSGGFRVSEFEEIDNKDQSENKTETEIQPSGPRPPRPIDVNDFGSFDLPKEENASANELRELLREKPEIKHELEDRIKKEEPEIYKEVKHVFEEADKKSRSGLGNIRLID